MAQQNDLTNSQNFYVLLINLNWADRNRNFVTLSYLLLPTSLISCRIISKRSEATLSVRSDDKFDPVECNNTAFVRPNQRYCATTGQNYTRVNYSNTRISYSSWHGRPARKRSYSICALIGGRWLCLPAADVFQHIIYDMTKSVLGADVIITD